MRKNILRKTAAVAANYFRRMFFLYACLGRKRVWIWFRLRDGKIKVGYFWGRGRVIIKSNVANAPTVYKRVKQKQPVIGPPVLILHGKGDAKVYFNFRPR